MSLSLYQASIPALTRILKNLSAILEKAATYAETKRIDPSVLINARLAPDMYPLSRQVQIASDGAKGCVARLAGIEVPSYPDIETTFPELQARIAKTIAFAESITASQCKDSETRTITLKLRDKEIHFTGESYVFNFVLPNVYFHVSIAYAILRHNGLDIGKADYMGKL